MKIHQFNLFAFVLFVLSFNAGLSAKELVVMSYNVENLFDTVDDPRWADEEFTPEGRAGWTNEKLLLKLENLTTVVRGFEEGKKACPDVLALIEVENIEILKFWNKHYLEDCGLNNIFIYQPETDEKIIADKRGIKVALMTHLRPAARPYLHHVYDGARYILEVNLQIGNDPITFFVNHWKSRIGGGEEKRVKSAEVLMRRLAEFQEFNPHHDFVVLGDFNDEPENKSVFKYLNVDPNPENVVTEIFDVKLWNTSYDLFYLPGVIEENRDYLTEDELQNLIREYQRKRGTYYYSKNKQFSQFDQILISRGLFDDIGFSYVPKSFQIHRPKDFTAKNGAPIPFKTGQSKDIGGAADHFPVIVKIQHH